MLHVLDFVLTIHDKQEGIEVSNRALEHQKE
jgi:hypothetical protein